MRFNGKVALITAAASGIGRATAGIIAAEGGRIAAVDNNRERLDATIAEITATGGEAFPFHANALDEAAVNCVVDDAVKRFGRIDILSRLDQLDQRISIVILSSHGFAGVGYGRSVSG